MKLDSGSLAFHVNIQGVVGGTPSWGTAIVFQDDENKIKENLASSILIGMIYKKIDCTSHNLSIPLGKGGHVYYGDDDYANNGAPSTPYLAAKFEKTYVNGHLVGKPFILLITKDGYDDHYGRLQLKYSPRISWGDYKNQEFFDEAYRILGLEENAPLVCYDISVVDQDTLCFCCAIKKEEFVFDSKQEYNKFLQEAIEQDSFIDKDTFINNRDDLYPLQLIYYGAPGTGKSHTIKEILESLAIPDNNVFRTTFHPDSDYSTFVGAYKPTMKRSYKYEGKVKASYYEDDDLAGAKKGDKIIEEKIEYAFVAQSFMNAYIQAYKYPEDNIYLVIEEINRGNCAQIFGDLFQLLDRKENGKSEYPIKADSDILLFLKNELGEDSEGIKGGKLCLPNNLYIWATMNTSDQSLFPIDSAFKRRWEWKYMSIKYDRTDVEILVGDEKFSWVKFQRAVNNRIRSYTSSEDKMIGDYFVGNKIITKDILVNKIFFYLWNDVCKDGDSDIFRISETEELSFSELYTDESKLLTLMHKLTDDKDSLEQENIQD